MSHSVPASNIKPRYPEDCLSCKFIGHLGRYDIYIHEDSPQIVARFGIDGDYLSSQGRLSLLDLDITLVRGRWA